MTDGVPLREDFDPDFPEEGVEPPAETLDEIIESLKRADEDVAAGRVVDAEVVLTEMRRKIDAFYESRRVHGAARRGG